MSDESKPTLSLNTLERLRREVRGGKIDWLIDLFIREVPNYVCALQKALKNQNGEELFMAAHKLKGSCSNLGGLRIVALCQQLEILGKTGNIQQSLIVINEQLPSEINQFCQELKAYKTKNN